MVSRGRSIIRGDGCLPAGHLGRASVLTVGHGAGLPRFGPFLGQAMSTTQQLRPGGYSRPLPPTILSILVMQSGGEVFVVIYMILRPAQKIPINSVVVMGNAHGCQDIFHLYSSQQPIIFSPKHSRQTPQFQDRSSLELNLISILNLRHVMMWSLNFCYT